MALWPAAAARPLGNRGAFLYCRVVPRRLVRPPGRPRRRIMFTFSVRKGSWLRDGEQFDPLSCRQGVCVRGSRVVAFARRATARMEPTGIRTGDLLLAKRPLLRPASAVKVDDLRGFLVAGVGAKTARMHVDYRRLSRLRALSAMSARTTTMRLPWARPLSSARNRGDCRMPASRRTRAPAGSRRGLSRVVL